MKGAYVMENAEQVALVRQQAKINGSVAELALRPGAIVDQQRYARFVPLEAVSQSSRLNEMDRHFRAGETVENGLDLLKRVTRGVLELDNELRAAAAEGASPLALSIIERLERAYGQAGGMVGVDFMERPYRLW
jgi:hypothetical protein